MSFYLSPNALSFKLRPNALSFKLRTNVVGFYLNTDQKLSLLHTIKHFNLRLWGYRMDHFLSHKTIMKKKQNTGNKQNHADIDTDGVGSMSRLTERNGASHGRSYLSILRFHGDLGLLFCFIRSQKKVLGNSKLLT